MTILFTDGFDSYNVYTGYNLLTRWTASSIPNNFSSSITPYGYGQSFYINSTTFYAQVSFTATSTFTVGMAVYLNSINTTSISYPLIEMFSGATSMILMSFFSDGSVQVYRQGLATPLVSSATNRVKSQTWYYVELSVTISDTVGTVRVDIDGQTVINQSNLDTRNGTPTTVDTFKPQSNNNNLPYIDDLYISDSITPLGPQRIYTLRPSADTAQKQWSPVSGWLIYPDISTNSASAFATKGNIFSALKNTSLIGVQIYFGAVAQTVVLGVALMTSVAGTVSSVVYQSSPVVRTAVAGWYTFSFPAVTLNSGSVYAIYVTRTDGTATSAMNLAGASNMFSDPTGSLILSGYSIIADNNITGGESMYTGSSPLNFVMSLIYTASNNYSSLVDYNIDDDSSYVSGSNVGDLDLYDVADYPAATATIKAVNHLAWARKTDATTRTMNLTTKSGATTTDSAAVTLSTSYAGYNKIYETDPNTGLAWTVSGVNALQIGQKVAS